MGAVRFALSSDHFRLLLHSLVTIVNFKPQQTAPTSHPQTGLSQNGILFYWWEDYVFGDEAEAFIAQSSLLSTILITVVLLPLAATLDRFESSSVFAVLGLMHAGLLLLLPVFRVKYFAWFFAVLGGYIFQLQSVVLNKFLVDYLLHKTQRLAYDVTAFNTLGSAFASLIAVGCGTLPRMGEMPDIVQSGGRQQYSMSGYQSWSIAVGMLAILAPVLWYMSALVARTATEASMSDTRADELKIKNQTILERMVAKLRMCTSPLLFHLH